MKGNEGDEAAKALEKLINLTKKYSETELDEDGLRESISERINATNELKDILTKAKNAETILINNGEQVINV